MEERALTPWCNCAAKNSMPIHSPAASSFFVVAVPPRSGSWLTMARDFGWRKSVLSKGRFAWGPTGQGAARTLESYQAQLLVAVRVRTLLLISSYRSRRGWVLAMFSDPLPLFVASRKASDKAVSALLAMSSKISGRECGSRLARSATRRVALTRKRAVRNGITSQVDYLITRQRDYRALLGPETRL